MNINSKKNAKHFSDDWENHDHLLTVSVRSFFDPYTKSEDMRDNFKTVETNNTSINFHQKEISAVPTPNTNNSTAHLPRSRHLFRRILKPRNKRRLTTQNKSISRPIHVKSKSMISKGRVTFKNDYPQKEDSINLNLGLKQIKSSNKHKDKFIQRLRRPSKGNLSKNIRNFRKSPKKLSSNSIVQYSSLTKSFILSGSSPRKKESERRNRIFKKFRRCVRKIYNAMKFMKLSPNYNEVNVHVDINKKKFYSYLNKYILTAEHGVYINCRPTFLTNIMDGVFLAYNFPDLPILKYCFLIMAIYCEFQEDSENTIYCYRRLKDIAEVLEDHDLITTTYKRRAEIFNKLKDFTSAEICYKQMLVHTWILNSSSKEIEAYEGLFKTYYHLSDMTRSTFYFKRWSQGRTESEFSKLRINTLNSYKNKKIHIKKVKPSFIMEKGFVRNFDQTDDYYFMDHYCEQEGIERNITSNSQYLMREIYKIKRLKDPGNWNIEKMDTKNTKMEIHTVRRGTPIKKVKYDDLPSPFRFGEETKISSSLNFGKIDFSRKPKVNKSHDFRLESETKIESTKSKSLERNLKQNKFNEVSIQGKIKPDPSNRLRSEDRSYSNKIRKIFSEKGKINYLRILQENRLKKEERFKKILEADQSTTIYKRSSTASKTKRERSLKTNCIMKSHIERCKVLKNAIGEEENFLSKITKLFKKLNDYIQKGLDTSYVKHIRKDLNVEGKLTFPRFFIPKSP
ncbi:unnamed protein product [Moneuplotes crassus]|uniref:Uncharacterized protein n=1 Tax=Euplotes crassus TaxID=5936 RepID=A0AAD2D7D4_EUPCR|nr:unnamed protein product [Moneuplotes crassus]